MTNQIRTLFTWDIKMNFSETMQISVHSYTVVFAFLGSQGVDTIISN